MTILVLTYISLALLLFLFLFEGQKRNFKKYNRATIDSLGTAYDYGSVMHYKADGFSTNGEPTIVPKKPGVSDSQSSN